MKTILYIISLLMVAMGLLGIMLTNQELGLVSLLIFIGGIASFIATTNKYVV